MDKSTQAPGLDLGILKQSVEELSEGIYSLEPKTLENEKPLLDLHKPLHVIEDMVRDLDVGIKPPKGLVGLFPEDTLSHVTDTLMVLAHVNWQNCGQNEEFACGMTLIWKVVTEALDYEKGRVGMLRKKCSHPISEPARGVSS